jgi:hypothetical protein
MKESIIAQTNVKSKVLLEGQFNYTANLTIGLAEGSDFYVVIDFVNLTMEDIKTLGQLYKLSKSLSIKSELIDKEKYNITHIIVTRMKTNSNLAMTWECISDDPSLDNSLIIE